MSQSLKILLLCLTAFLLLVAGYLATGKSSQPKPSFGITIINRGDLVSTVSATGTLNPMISVQVGTQVSGIIQQLYVDFNSPVKKGALIAQIEPSLFKTQVTQAQANLQSAKASRDKTKITTKDAKRQLDQVSGLHQKGVSSQNELDAAKFAYEEARVEQRVKEAMAAQAQAALEQTEVNLAHTSIHAPIDGVVISRDVDVGQTVAASLQAPTIFSIAQDLTRMQIETEVDEAFIGTIRDGQPVSFNVFAYPGKTFSGRVVQIRLKPSVEAGVVKYNCIIEVSNPDLALKPGMTATVTIEVDRRQDILKVVNAALRFVPDLPAPEIKKLQRDIKRGEDILWLVDGQDLKPLKVTRGLVGETESEIINNTLQTGIRVAIPADKNKNSAPRRGISLF